MKVFLTAIAVAALTAGLILLPGFVFMLVMGAIAAEFDAPTAISFWPALGIFWGTRFLVSGLTTNGQNVRVKRS